MKWVARFKDKVGLPNLPSPSHDVLGHPSDLSPGKSRDAQESEPSFKTYWEEFRSSSSEKGRERALEMALDMFCKLARRTGNAVQAVNMLVDARVFSFVVAKALTTKVNALKNQNTSGPQVIERILRFLTESPEEAGDSDGMNMLYALQCLVSPPLDLQPLLDSGLLSCMVWVLYIIFGKPGLEKSSLAAEDRACVIESGSEPLSKLMEEGSFIHIMKALAQHPGATQSLAEDNSLRFLFHIAAINHEKFSATNSNSLKSHAFLSQLHRQALQILSLLLNNDNGSSAHYIHNHQLIKVLLMVIREFDIKSQDAEYAVDVVDLIFQCVELSCRIESSVMLRDDLHNAHGYRFLVQFALTIVDRASTNSDLLFDGEADLHHSPASQQFISKTETDKDTEESLPLVLTRLLDIIVSLSQVGLSEAVKAPGSIGRTFLFSDPGASPNSDEISMDGKIKDMEAVQVLQDIFLKATNVQLQLEVLDRLLGIFSSHVENYLLCQELRILPLFILNIPSLPEILLEHLLKILEYAVTVINCNPEQELLSLCCLLQQPLTSRMQQNILLFFSKLLSFDNQYKKVLREVGALELLLDDIKKSTLLNPERSIVMENSNETNRNILSREVTRPLSSSDTDNLSTKTQIFEDETTVSIAWNFLVSMLKGTEANQTAFRKMNGIAAILPLLNSPCNRGGVLRVITNLICEDVKQLHPEELGTLIEVVKSGLLGNSFNQQNKVDLETRKDILWAIHRILSVNNASKDTFGATTGFSILLTIMCSFQTEEGSVKGKEELAVLSVSHLQIFTALLNVVKEAVSNNPPNRLRLHKIISSQTFKELFYESGLLCAEHEEVVADMLLSLAIEKKSSPGEIAVLSHQIEASNQRLDENGTFLGTCPDINLYDSETCDIVLNVGSLEVVISSIKFFSSGLQLKVLDVVKQLSQGCSYNKETMTIAGCLSLLLNFSRTVSSNEVLFKYVLSIVEILGSYRLSTSELRLLVRWIWLSKDSSSKSNNGKLFLESMRRMIQLQLNALENNCSPFIEMSTVHSDYSFISISLGDRQWPPAAGYTFAIWLKYHKFRRSRQNAIVSSKLKDRPVNEFAKIRIFSVGTAEERSQLYCELYLEESGILTLTTSSNHILTFKGVILEEGIWQHVVVVHNKPNILAGLFQSSIAFLYVNGRLRQTGKLGYTASHAGKTLQATIGSSNIDFETFLHWSLGSSYLFEEVLPSQSVFLMYALGRRYCGLFQDADLLRFVAYEACSGRNLATLEGLDTELALANNSQKVEESLRASRKVEGSGVVWDVERLSTFVNQLSTKKLIFCFNGTHVDNTALGCTTLINIVDPLSSVASPFGGLPLIARVTGNIFVCSPCGLNENIRKVGGVAVVLALVEIAESKEALHVALALLQSVLYWSPQNARDMSAMRGYHLLAMFLKHRMCHFDMQALDMLLQIAACETSLVISSNLDYSNNSVLIRNNNLDNLVKAGGEEVSPFGSQIDAYEYSQPDIMSHISDTEINDLHTEISNGLVLMNMEMMEYVLLDWTLWVSAPASIQLALIGSIERLMSMHKYRIHNLTLLRKINVIPHILVTLQRGDVEIPALEKFVQLIRILLDDGFLMSELQYVVDFIMMTFEPLKVRDKTVVPRESGGMHVVVRNMLLEMLIDIQVTISSDEVLELWHKNVSLRLITNLLDEAVYPTTMRCVMTLLGVCLSSSSNFETKFRASFGFQTLVQVLPSFFDCPEIYYILFCLMMGKSVYPREPEVRMYDFLGLMPDNGSSRALFFPDLLEAILAMSRTTFDRLFLQIKSVAHVTDQVQRSLWVDDNFSSVADSAEQLQGEALLHKTYAARLLGGEAAAPSVVTSLMRFMVDLAKMCPEFSAAFRRQELLESCCDLYFSCVRAAYAAHISQFDQLVERHEFDDVENALSASSENVRRQESVMSYTANLDGTDTLHSPDNTSVGNRFENSLLQSSEDTLPDANHVSNVQFTHASNLVSSDIGENMVDKEAESQIVLTPRSSVSETSGLLSSSRLSYSMSTTPFDLSASWKGSSSQSDTNQGLSILTPCASMNRLGSDVHYKLSSAEGCSDDLLTELKPIFLLQLNVLGSSGGPCSSSSVAVLDLIAEVLADSLSGQLKALSLVEIVLETTPLGVLTETSLVFQGLCLGRVMNSFERRLLRDDEEVSKRLDKSKWSSNLDSFSYLLVDCVYTGAFSESGSVLKVLEFLLSMLQLANKDGRVEGASLSGKSLLSLGRNLGRQVEAFVQALLKNINRMIMFCYICSIPKSVEEEEKLELKQVDVGENSVTATVDPCTLLQLVIFNRQLIFSSINQDTDLVCCLCVNTINMLSDTSLQIRMMAGEVMKSLIYFRKAALEELLIIRTNQGGTLDLLHNGFDKLLHADFNNFYAWFNNCKETIFKVLDQRVSIMWKKYKANTAKSSSIRMKQIENRRKREGVRRIREMKKLADRHWDKMNERRACLDDIRDSIGTDLSAIRQEKYGCLLHAESEWYPHIQQLVHERGILSALVAMPNKQLDWELCPAEGPYRMRKKLVPCKMRIDVTCNYNADVKLEFESLDGNSFLHQFSADDVTTWNKLSGSNQGYSGDADGEENSRLIDDAASSSVYSGPQLESDNIPSQFVTNTSLSAQISITGELSESIQTSTKGSFHLSEDSKYEETKGREHMHSNIEYLITPFLESSDKIRHMYNCERVVGLEKKVGLFLIGESCLYIIENFYINEETGHIHEKVRKEELSVIDQAIGVKSSSSQYEDITNRSAWQECVNEWLGAREWAYTGYSWGVERVQGISPVTHSWRRWKLDSVHELLKRRYQLRPVAIEIFSVDGCNDLLVFHKNERDEVFKNLIAMNLPRNNMLDATISGVSKKDVNESVGLFKRMAKSFSKRWQNGEISNFQYLMHLNTLAGRGYNDLTQYPVFPWVLADYDSEYLNLEDPNTFRQLDKPMGALNSEREDEFKRRYDNWDDPEIPPFHYGSHYSSAGIVLFYLIRLPPFSMENKKLQGGQFDHADRLFYSVKDTWLSASQGNTADVKELIPEFFYLPEMFENRFNLDLGFKQSGEKVNEVLLPPWAKGSAREFVRKHREALESPYVSENLHHWIDLIFGFRQQGKAAEDATNVFFYLTYEDALDIDSIHDPTMKASILAQINHFGQTPRQLFQKPHPKRIAQNTFPLNVLGWHNRLTPLEIRTFAFSISQIVCFHEKILASGVNRLLKPRSFRKYVAWGFPDKSLRFFSHDQDKLLSTHEGLHGNGQIKCVDISRDGRILVTGGEDGVVSVWRLRKQGVRKQHYLELQRSMCGHMQKVTCLAVCQPYNLIVSGSDDCSVILWDLCSLEYVRQLPLLPSAVSAVHANEMTGNIVTAAGTILAIWSINGDCLATRNTSQLPSDAIVSLTSSCLSDWMGIDWFITGHQSGSVKLWHMDHISSSGVLRRTQNVISTLSDNRSTYDADGKNETTYLPEYHLTLLKVLKWHKQSVTSVYVSNDLKLLLSGDSAGHLISWILPEDPA